MSDIAFSPALGVGISPADQGGNRDWTGNAVPISEPLFPGSRTDHIFSHYSGRHCHVILCTIGLENGVSA